MRMLGAHLGLKARAEVLSAYVHRFTGNHIPGWADKRRTPMYLNDQQWLESTWFEVTASGKLDKRFKHCTSYNWQGKEKT